MIVDDSVMQAKATAQTVGATINLDFNPCVHPVYTHTTYTYINIFFHHTELEKKIEQRHLCSVVIVLKSERIGPFKFDV